MFDELAHRDMVAAPSWSAQSVFDELAPTMTLGPSPGVAVYLKQMILLLFEMILLLFETILTICIVILTICMVKAQNKIT